MSPDGAPTRMHESLAHTADVGLRATAPDLPGLFEEAAIALAEIAADVSDEGGSSAATGPSATGPSLVSVRIVLQAPDLPALAFGWLNELIGLADMRRAALASATVERIHASAGEAFPSGEGSAASTSWKLEAVARFAPFGPRVRPRLGVKSATYHGLDVRSDDRGWSMAAYLDV